MVNVGLESFAVGAESLGVPIVHVALGASRGRRSRAGAAPRAAGRRDGCVTTTVRVSANGAALSRLTSAQPVLVGLPARRARRSASTSTPCSTRGRRCSGASGLSHRAGRPFSAPSATRAGPPMTPPPAGWWKRPRHPGLPAITRARPTHDGHHHRLPCRSSWWRIARSATARMPPSTKAWGRCCASARQRREA